MRNLSLLAVVLSLTAIVVSAQHLTEGPLPKADPTALSTDKLYAVREKLIRHYVPTYAWGVAMCGGDDVLNGRQYAWLCMYVYEDSLRGFVKALLATDPTEINQGVFVVDGVAVDVRVIERAKPQ